MMAVVVALLEIEMMTMMTATTNASNPTTSTSFCDDDGGSER